MEGNIRKEALEILLRIEKSGSYSHLLIDQAIQQGKIAKIDEQLLTEIVYGTLERKLTLDYYLAPFIQKQKKLQDWVRMLLRMSVFQMEYLDNVPTYAIINEAVEIAKQKGHKGIANVVNGVLRNVQRQGVRDLNLIEDKVERLAIATSHPLWLVRRWVAEYGFEITKEMCERNVTKKPLHLRVNRLKNNREAVLQALEAADIEASASPYIEEGIVVTKGNVLKTNLLQTGDITIQDHSSMFAAKSLDVTPQMQVLDTCSAPGGKATYIAELMDNEGKVYAYDLHKNKIKLIDKNVKRLGLTNVNTQAQDARTLSEVHEEKSFDRIIVDAPCTGLGVLRSKADIKYNKQEKDIDNLQQVQLAILNEVAPLLKDNGKLVYSTCTVNKTENNDLVKSFLNEHKEYEVDEAYVKQAAEQLGEKALITAEGVQLFPQTMNADGFFITRFVKK
ncbi:MAG TPA: 16S rRNA (cytosine(967)-C(5))-methyltransferase RsmB [Pseudogracilibacillus sp.]|nr:16S rRNA (cytosine(967)-C(5))-methyltransferase RsmB [Pseudogracilibacillus sp.]